MAARTKHRLSPESIPALAAGKHPDGGGLTLEVAPSGTRSWTVRFSLHGRECYQGLGGYPTIGLARARELAEAARATAREGRDPREARRAAAQAQDREGRTVKDAIRGHIDAQRPAWRAATLKANESLLVGMDAPGGIARLPLSTLTTEQIVERLQPAWMKTPQRARKMADLCVWRASGRWRSGGCRMA